MGGEGDRSQGTTVLELLASKDETLLIGRDALLVLDLLLHVLDGVGTLTLHIKSDGLARQGLDKDLHTRTTTKTKHQVKA